MRAGVIISASAHIALIVLAIWGLPQTEEDDAEEIRFSEVDIISVSEFEAMRSSAPEVDPAELAEIAPPDLSFNAAAAPEAEALPEDTAQDFVEAPSEADTEPDLTALRTEVAEPDVTVEIDELPGQETETAFLQPETAPEPVETPRSGAVSISRPPQPRDAPRIDTSEAPPPPQEAEPAEEVVEDTTPEETPEEVVEEEEPTAPEEATTAESIEEESPQPLRPQRRPDNIAELVRAAAAAEARRLVEEEEERLRQERLAEEAERQRQERLAEEQRQREADAQRQAEAETVEPEEPADEIAALLDQANQNQPAQPETQPVAQSLPVGPPLSGTETEGILNFLNGCWVVPDGIKGAQDLQVTLRFELTQDGKVVGEPQLIEPTSGDDPSVRTAFEAARRAIYRCNARGFDLPQEKYAHWRVMEITFDPRGVLGW